MYFTSFISFCGTWCFYESAIYRRVARNVDLVEKVLVLKLSKNKKKKRVHVSKFKSANKNISL